MQYPSRVSAVVFLVDLIVYLNLFLTYFKHFVHVCAVDLDMALAFFMSSLIWLVLLDEPSGNLGTYFPTT